MFSRDFRRQQRAKFKIYLSFEGARASVVALSLGRWSCPLGAGLPAFEAAGPAGVGSDPLVVCSLPFCPLYCLVFGGMLANMPLFAILRGFLAGFMVRMYIYMG